MENLEVLKQFGITSLEDAREFAELTDHIVANLEAIDENNDDLEALLEAANLKFIDEDNTDLDVLVEKTNNIVANLKVIEEKA